VVARVAAVAAGATLEAEATEEAISEAEAERATSEAVDIEAVDIEEEEAASGPVPTGVAATEVAAPQAATPLMPISWLAAVTWHTALAATTSSAISLLVWLTSRRYRVAATPAEFLSRSGRE